MQCAWRKVNNHIGLQCGQDILHPSAVELYEVLHKKETAFSREYNVKPLEECFSKITFSQIGSDIFCELLSDDKGEIELKLWCVRKDKQVEVDFIEGTIIDQCLSEDEWFYITGNTEELEAIFCECGVKQSGKITLAQYIYLLKKENLLINGTLINRVSINTLDKAIDKSKTLPCGLEANLYEYQKVGYLWMSYMLRENQGCILGDEMGLGKTLQIITVMLEMKSNEKGPMLVIAPVSLLQNWKRECEKFAPSLNVLIHHGKYRTGRYAELNKYDVVVASYNAAVSDSSLLKMIEWELLVLDEAQNIKNPYSDRTKYVKKIPKKNSIAVTGTPFENHVMDVWSLADFVMPGLFGTQTEFSEQISDDIYGADRIEPLLSPIMIRRRVLDVAKDLPDKVVIPQMLKMSEIEALKYEELREEIENSSNGGNISLGMLQKLRMFCTHPALCDESLGERPKETSIKYQRTCEIIEEVIAREEKVILFTSYQKMFDVLETDIQKRFSIPVMKINGSTVVEERQNIVDEFSAYAGSALLILNPRAAGVGLNITAANHVIHYNLEWNPALEDQSSARAYRRGQRKTVFIYRLFYEGTVEEIVNQRIDKKRLMAEAAIVGTDGSNENKEDLLAAIAISPIKER